MYVCKDCGSKYAEKVEYCECGNNVFDYIEDKKTVVNQPRKKQPLTIEQKSEFISKLFLIFCIILSVIVWIIPVKIEETQKTTQIAIPKADLKIIPSIDKIWDDTPIFVEKKEEDVVINDTPIVLNEMPDYAKPIFKEQKKQNLNTSAKQQDTKTKVLTPKTTQQVEKQKTVQRQEQKKTEQITQKTQSASNINKLQTPKQNMTSQQIAQTQQTKAEPSKVEKQKSTYNPNSPTMLKYKGSLRAAMFSKFAVGSISGSGSCSVKFSIDSTGKLINRAFVKKSDNKSLNDAVYYMMMSVPKFTPPPTEYNGETIQMNFNINNGEYEISIY